MTRRVERCNACDSESRPGRYNWTLEEWAERAKTCFFCGLVDALLQDAKKKHGIDPSGGGRYEVGAVSGTDMEGRYYIVGKFPEHETDKKITAEIAFYNPTSKSSSFALPSSHDN